MKVLIYVGDHKKDAWSVRVGWWLTRLVQRGPYQKATHTEGVLSGENYKCCTIGSSSARDGGVRVKRDVELTPGNWEVIDVPTWDVELAAAWFVLNDGKAYDWCGAAATRLFWLHGATNKFFCNEANGAPFILEPDQYSPCQFMAIALSMPGARLCTSEFFTD